MNLDSLEAEYSKLQADHAAFARQLEQVQAELKPLNEVRYWGSQVLGAKEIEVLINTKTKPSVRKRIKKDLNKIKTSKKQVKNQNIINEAR